jgi:hypothetical protein
MSLPKFRNSYGLGLNFDNNYLKFPKKQTKKIIKTIKDILTYHKIKEDDKNTFSINLNGDYFEFRLESNKKEVFSSITKIGIIFEFNDGTHNYSTRIKSKSAYKKLKKVFKKKRREYDNQKMGIFLDKASTIFNFNRELNLEKLLNGNE